MNISFSKRNSALTLIEVVIVLAVIGLFVAALAPGIQKMRAHDQRIQCANNLKQVGLAFRIWSGNHGNRFPMAVPATNGGTEDFITGLNAFRHLQVMSNELVTPKILFCPTESDRYRFPATNFNGFSNSNISYFIGVDANETNENMLLSGDHNLTNGTPVANGILQLTTNQPTGWTAQMHEKIGFVLKADGSLEGTSTFSLQRSLAESGVTTNRLQMP